LWAQVLGRWSESGFPGVTCVAGGCSKARIARSAPSEVWWIDEKAHDDDEGGGRDIDRSSEKKWEKTVCSDAMANVICRGCWRCSKNVGG